VNPNPIEPDDMKLVQHWQVGQQISVRALKADGTCYRWWQAAVEAVEPARVVLVTPPGHRVESLQGGWTSANAVRTYYWLKRWYSLLEVYTPAGELVEVYVNINSPAEISSTALSFTDYELDVQRLAGDEARLLDEDEFLEAATRYNYSAELQQTCYQAAAEAMELANGWLGASMPNHF
jgi:protein associated with RNAse G/E